MKFGHWVKIGAFGSAVLFVLMATAIAYYFLQERHYEVLADTHNLRMQIIEMGEKYVAKRPKAALVMGVWQGGQSHVQGFGHLSSTNSNPPDSRTMFEIGSITKVFTALTLAQMAEEGAVKLDDPISVYLPKGVTVPGNKGRPITLRHLATHTSGLPRLPDNFDACVKDQQNPYAAYGTNQLYESLAGVRLRSEPGTKSEYSNYGFGLLGHLLELKAGKPYAQLIEEKICRPLGLSNTVIRLSEAQQVRLAPGHSPKGELVPNWDLAAVSGAGALRSDAEDLLRLVAINLNENPPVLRQALAEAQRFHFKETDGGVGLGWQIAEPGDQLLHWHNGGTGGYVSFIGFDKLARIGVVILSNYGDAFAGDSTVDNMGMKVLRIAPKVSWE